MLGFSVIVAPGVFGGLWRGPDGLLPIRDVPDDNPRLGLVYEGLAPAKSGAPCVGAYEVVQRDTCTHGPDEAPPGLDVGRSVQPVARVAPVPALPRRDISGAPRDKDIAADEGAVNPGETAPAIVPEAAAAEPAGDPAADPVVGPGGVVCDGDGITGKRVQVLYVYEAGTASRYSQYLASFRTWAAGVDAIYNASAQDTGGIRHLRYVTTADCQIDVAEVQVPAGALVTFNATITALKNLGYKRTDRKYVLFADAKVYCGIGTFTSDASPGSGNRNNRGPSYGRSDAGCWTASVAAHELAHNLGAVLNSAPNSSKAGHCTDDYDVMCYKDAPGTVVRVVCPERAKDKRLDCNHDDYYHTDPSPGSYLATHWNVASSDFLIGKPAAGGTPGPPPAPTPTPAPTATAAPTPTATPTPPATQPNPTGTAVPPPAPPPANPPPAPPPAVGVPLDVIDTTSTSTRLAWPGIAPGTRYAIVLDDRTIGWTTARRVRVIGLRPDTPYRMQVSVRGADGTLRLHAGPKVVHTAPASQPSPGALFQLTNALTGGAASLYGARGAKDTPLVLGRRDTAVNQQWRLDPVPNGSYQLRSNATGQCATARGAVVAGAVIVQQPCAAADVTQHWRVRVGSHGFTLAPASGGALVIGLSRLRYGGQHLLVLQPADNSRYQSWSALPV
ncbi:MAG TPA: RICIN domain-containing protein, partial [Pilimelia sp.]|nr:RICIN domain-containing protein [Pilimelia sp.]